MAKETAASKAEELVDHDPVFKIALNRGILSIRRAARWAIDRYEWDHSVEAVVSGLRRYGNKLEGKEWDYLEELNILYEIANSYRTIRSNPGEEIVPDEVIEKGDKALERLEKLDEGRVELGRRPLLSDYSRNSNVVLSNRVLGAVAYFHQNWNSPTAELMDDVISEISEIDYNWDDIQQILEEHIAEGRLSKKVENGRTIIIPSKDILEDMPDDHVEGIGHMLNEIEYSRPPIEEPIESGVDGVKDRLEEFEFFPYSIEGDILKTGLLVVSAEDREWNDYKELGDKAEELSGVNRTDLLIKRYLSELEENGALKSRGNMTVTEYQPTRSAIRTFEKAETLKDVLKLVR